MKKLLYIDACVRDSNSRTKKISTPLIEKLKEKYQVTTLCLNDLNLTLIQKELFEIRQNGNIDQNVLYWANLMKETDCLVISAPFWDMSIPACLKVFIELISLFNVTFTSDDKTCFGLCKCQKVLYITTRGMNIKTNSELDQATPYLKALSQLWNLGEIITLARENFDYLPEEEIKKAINEAINEGLKIIEDF